MECKLRYHLALFQRAIADGQFCFTKAERLRDPNVPKYSNVQESGNHGRLSSILAESRWFVPRQQFYAKLVIYIN